MKKPFTLFIFLIVCIGSVSAQKAKRTTHLSKIDPVVQMYKDTFAITYQHYFGALDSLNNDTFPERFLTNDPRYYRLFVPLTYYYSPVERIFNNGWKFKEPENGTENPVNKLVSVDNTLFYKTERINRIVDRTLLHVYLSHPEWTVDTEENIMRKKVFQQQIVTKLPPKINVIELFNPDPVDSNVGEMDLNYRRPNFWYTSGSGALQFSQNFISKNWYKGGESSNSMLTHLILSARYDDKSRLEFDNSFEAKLGFNTVPSDTVNKYNINTDLLRISSKLGVKAIANWYYTIGVEFKTQFCASYGKNSKVVKSAFLAPANLAINIGMDYKIKKKRIDLSVFIAPGTYDLRYIGNDKVDEVAFGLKEGHTTLSLIGSRFETKMRWNIIPTISWDTRLYYFTNYEKVEAEWENTLNFVLNKYLSTQIFVHARFDDSVQRKDFDNSYFQLKEFLSFGLNYRW